MMIYMTGMCTMQGTLYCAEKLERAAEFYIKKTKVEG
jgi:hypothetical protein